MDIAILRKRDILEKVDLLKNPELVLSFEEAERTFSRQG